LESNTSKMLTKLVRSILSTALAAAVLCQSCVRNVEPQPQQPPEWADVPIPPIVSISVNTLASDAQGTLYLGAAGSPAIWRSTDRGRTWTEKTIGINPCCGVTSFLVKEGSTVFAALPGAGVFISRDHGDKWIQINNHLTDLEIRSLTTAGAGEILAATEDGAIFRSSDDGAIWVEEENVPSIARLTALATDSTGTIYAGWWNQGVLFSTDGGRTWTLSSDDRLRYVDCLAIDNDGNVLAGTADGVICRSAGGGEPWIQIYQSVPNRSVLAIATDPAGWIFAGKSSSGVIRSRDGGASWEWADIGVQGQLVYSLLWADGVMLAGVGNDGVFRSIDGGDSWSWPRDYFPDDPTRYQHAWQSNTLSIDSCDTYYLLNDRYIYRSTDGGETWISACDGILGPLHCLAIHPSSSILAGSSGGIFRSNDSGDTWSRADTFSYDFRGAYTLDVAGDGTIYARNEPGVSRSTDGGVSWECVLNDVSEPMCLSAGADGCVYLGTRHEGVLASHDYGATWRRITDSLLVYSIDADRLGDVFAVYEGGILVSRDGGETWNLIQRGQGFYWYSVLVSPGGEVAIVSDDNGTLLISNDCFSTWRSVHVPYSRSSMFLSPDGHLFFSERYFRGLHRSREALF
jgi:photosystem II stability/assembly factor-like uncharacterized protein